MVFKTQEQLDQERNEEDAVKLENTVKYDYEEDGPQPTVPVLWNDDTGQVITL